MEQAEIVDEHGFWGGLTSDGLVEHGSMIMMERMIRHDTWYDSDSALRFLLP